MTLDELKNSDEEVLTAADIAPILQCDPDKIRRQAHADPAMLGFPVSVILSRVKIPRRAFIAWMEGSYHEEDSTMR